MWCSASDLRRAAPGFRIEYHHRPLFVISRLLVLGIGLALLGTQFLSAQHAYLLKDLKPGPEFHNITAIVGVNGKAVIFGYDSSTYEHYIWASDSTPEGTTLIKTLGGNPYVGPKVDQGEIKAIGNQIYFSMSDTTYGSEPWVTDGTPDGTRLLKDIRPGGGNNSSFPIGFAEYGGKAYFTAAIPPNFNQFETWVSDGTELGTERFASTQTASNTSPYHYTESGGTLYFVGLASLWATDGTPENTRRVKNFVGGVYGTPTQLIDLNGTLLFAGSGGSSFRTSLWKSDGTEAGTVEIKNILPGAQTANVYQLTVMNGSLFFVGIDDNGVSAWRSDGTPEGTVPLFPPGPGPLTLMKAEPNLFFYGPYNGVDGLWKSDGMPGGMEFIKNWRNGDTNSGYTAFQGQLVFGVSCPDESSPQEGVEPWVSDGTTDRTVQMQDLNAGTDASYPRIHPPVGDTLYLWAFNPSVGLEIYGVKDLTVDNALLRSKSIPSILQTGETAEARYTYTNVGNTTWSAPAYSLNIKSDLCGLFPGPSDPVRPFVNVEPGRSYTFYSPITAPAFPGSCHPIVQMNGPEVGLMGKEDFTNIFVQGKPHDPQPRVIDIYLVADCTGSDVTVTVEGPPGTTIQLHTCAYGTINMEVTEVGGQATEVRVKEFELGTEDVHETTPFPINLTGMKAVMDETRGTAGEGTPLEAGSFNQTGNQVEFDGAALVQIENETFEMEGGPGSGQLPLDFSGMLEKTPGGGYQLIMPVNIVREVKYGNGPYNPKVTASGVFVAREASSSPFPLNNAGVAAGTVPTKIPRLHRAPATITMHNNGNTVWSANADHKLAVISDPCGLFPAARLPLHPTTPISPGEEFTFSTTLQAPDVVGVCEIQFQMTQELVEFFGESRSLNVEVEEFVNAASYISSSIPAILSSNEGLGFGITLMNQGNTIWSSENGYSLRVVGDGCAVIQNPIIPLRMGDSAVPNQSYQFLTYMTAPASEGPCSIRLQMFDEVSGAFGDIAEIPFQVGPKPNMALDWTAYE